MRLVIKKDSAEAACWAAEYIAGKINAHAGSGGDRDSARGPFRLGLPTGSSPLGIYRELVSRYKAGKVSFRNVVTYNMDEYLGLPPDHPQSYHRFMWDNFFSHVDIQKENVHILDGMAKDPDAECEAYEQGAAGGFHLFLGGVGQNGHLAFNEPGSSPASKTRVITLTTDTRIVNARFFGGDMESVPKKALSMGIGTVLSAAEVLIIVTGYAKARALKAAVEGGISQMWPVSFLQTHPRGIIVCDEAATEELKVGTVRHFKGD
ncbi:MAG: glucosamine-6-phosphate deaminase [Treponema sp.]|jgi:glucosamine-6-phosphate deaminase|nr:glucosamine-6-phosphate deaminase [Treponema sp.]